MGSETQLPSADNILRMLMEAEANGGKFLRAVDQETLVGGKRVTKQKVPKLPESAVTTIHQVKVTLYGQLDRLPEIVPPHCHQPILLQWPRRCHPWRR